MNVSAYTRILLLQILSNGAHKRNPCRKRGKHIVFESKGGIDSRWEWTISAEASTTAVSLALTYTMPGSFLGVALNKLVIEGQNAKDIEGQLAALKRLSEGSPTREGG